MKTTSDNLERSYQASILENPATIITADYKAHTVDLVNPKAGFSKDCPYWYGFSSLKTRSDQLWFMAQVSHKPWMLNTNLYALAKVLDEVTAFMAKHPRTEWKN